MSLSEQLVSWVLSAMLAWVPLGNQYERAHDGRWLHDAHGYFVKENADEALARYKVTAQAIADVALDPANPPLFRGETGRAKTALQLGSIGSFEGGFHKFVESGDCNTPAFKANHPHECDGGAAWTNFQIHLYRYIIRGGEMFQAQYLEQSNNKDDREWIKNIRGRLSPASNSSTTRGSRLKSRTTSSAGRSVATTAASADTPARAALECIRSQTSALRALTRTTTTTPSSTSRRRQHQRTCSILLSTCFSGPRRFGWGSSSSSSFS